MLGVMETVARLAGAVAPVVAAVVVLAVVWVARALKKRRGRLPPGPMGLPVVGNLFHLLLGGQLPHRTLAELSRKYGPILFLRLGAAPTVVISDCSLAKACLTSPNDKIFASRPPMEASRRLVFGTSPGLAMAPYGEEWRHARKLCSLQLFTTRRVNEFEPFRRSEIVALVHKIKHQIETRKPGSEEHMNLSQAITSLTEGMTYRMLLGKPSMEIGDARLGINMQVLVQRITHIFQVPIIGDFIPSLGFLDGKAKAALDEVHAGFGLLIDNLIRERQQRPQGSPTVILDVLLENLDTDRAKSIMMELIVAAIDTSATTLDWAMAELIANPEAMRKVQEELDKIAQGEARIIEEEELGSLEYMKAVVKETMRLHAPVPLLVPHMSTEECEVGGYTIPKGSRLLVNAWAIGRDPKSWEEPERFLPERFLSDKGSLIDLRGQHFELLPFGSGRRSCPGLPLALPLVESTLANLLHTFDWHLPPGLSVDLSERFGAVVNRANALYAVPHLRHKMSS